MKPPLINLVFVLGAAAMLCSCGEARSESVPHQPAVREVTGHETARPDKETAETAETEETAETIDTREALSSDAVVRFSDILDQYRALNSRLEAVSARLQIANASLCPAVIRDPGFTVHSLSDYPEPLQQVARSFLPVDEGLSVRTVRDGSPAQAAGLRAGDKLVGVNGQRFVGGRTQKIFYDRVTTVAFAAETASLTIARRNQSGTTDLMSFDMRPQTICGYPAHVVFDETVNGHTDGSAIWITSELMRTVEDDVNLALIVAHEMAHALAGHLSLSPTDEERKRLELMADSMALVMLSRAGFDSDRAVSYWTRADNPQRLSQSRSNTHPSISQRLENFEAAQRAIEAAKRRGALLDFSILPAPAL